MSWLQFIDSMFGRLAWPLVVLILAFMLRKQLAALTDRVLELSFGGATVKFGDLIAKGTEIVDEAPEEPVRVKEQAEALQEHLSRMQEEREIDAREVWERYEASLEGLLKRRAALHIHDTGARNVFIAFEEVEDTLTRAGAALGVKARGAPLMQMLLRRELVTNELVELYNSLRNARNAIAHGESNLPNEGEAMEFGRQATFLLARLMIVIDKIVSEGRARGEEKDGPE